MINNQPNKCKYYSVEQYSKSNITDGIMVRESDQSASSDQFNYTILGHFKNNCKCFTLLYQSQASDPSFQSLNIICLVTE